MVAIFWRKLIAAYGFAWTTSSVGFLNALKFADSSHGILASHPGGSSNTPSRFMLRKPELSTGHMGHWARIKAFFFRRNKGNRVFMWRRGGLMVNAFDSGSGGPGSSPGRGHCVVFLGKTLYSHSASLHPGVQMGTSKCAGGNPAMD